MKEFAKPASKDGCVSLVQLCLESGQKRKTQSNFTRLKY